MRVAEKRSHTVVYGETLRTISIEYYGNEYCWQRIWLANQQTLKNPENIMPGQILIIP